MLRDLFSRSSVENPAKPLTDVSLLEALGGHPTWSGVVVTEEKALQLIPLFRGVELIAGTGAATPLKTYKTQTRERVTVRIIEAPHPHMTDFEFWECAYAHIVLWGNFYAYKEFDGLGRLAELWPLHPGHVTPKIITSGPNKGDKVFIVRTTDGEQDILTPDEIFHIPGVGYDGVKGMSRIQFTRQSLGIAFAADEYAARFFAQDATPGGTLETDGKLTDDQFKRLKAEWKATHQGVRRSHEPALLEGGVKWKTIGIPPEDAQLLLTRQFSVSDQARLLGLPPHMLGDVEKSTSWGTGIEQQTIGFVVYTMRSYYTRIERRVSRDLTGVGIFAEYDVNGLLRGDIKTRFDAYGRAVGGPWMIPNEARELENKEPVEGGDKLYQPANMLTAADQGGSDGSSGTAN